MTGRMSVTGSIGYVGCHICQSLAAVGFRPIAFYDLLTGPAALSCRVGACGRDAVRADLASLLDASVRSGEMLLEIYRERDTAEGHVGEPMDVLAPALSLAPRPKIHYDDQPVAGHDSDTDAFAHNEVVRC